MGGIAGVRVLSGAAVAAGTLQRMVDLLRHRGPDGSGTWVGADVGLAQTRLAVVGGEHEAQPMTSVDGRWVLALDGEVLNHEVLRSHLDYPFRTRGDTEVVLAGLAIEGIAFVERLQGQFALVAHDHRTDTTHLVRDRLGIVPLHYRHVPGGIAFASEVKALLAVGPAPQVDVRSLDAYLAGRSVPSPDTLFEGIKKVRPAHRVSMMPGGHVEEARWWTPPECDAEGTWSASDAIEAVGDGVREAVRTSLVPDVPVGVHLRGDLGSSLVVAQVRQLRDDPVHTFSIGFGDGTEEDLSASRRVGALLATQHHEVHVDPNELESLWTRLTWHRDAPISGLEDVASFAMARAAREHVGVVLSATGGDELFGGRGSYRYARIAERSHALPSPLRAALSGPVERHLGATFTALERQRLLGATAPSGRLRSTTSGRDPVDRMLRHDLGHDLPDLLLEGADRMSKAASLEVRPALLDHRLVELAFRLPTSVKVRPGCTQWVLREVARSLLPEEVIEPQRSGPRTSSASWLCDGLHGTVRDRLTGSGSWVGQTLDRAMLSDLVSRYDRHPVLDARILALLSLEVWHECFFDAPPRGARPSDGSSYGHAS